MELPGAVEYVLVVEDGGFVVYGGFGFPVDKFEPEAAVGDFGSEDFEEPVTVDFVGDPPDELGFAFVAVDSCVFFPGFGLGGLYEGEEGLGVEGKGPVELSGVAFFVSPMFGEVGFNIFFKLFFG